MSDPNWLDSLRKKRDYLVEWLARFKSASRVAPEVQKNLDFTEWQIRAIETRPDEGSEIPFPNLGGTISRDLSYVQTAYPWLPQFNDQDLNVASAFSSTSTSQVSIYIGRVGDIDSQETNDYAERFMAEFEGLQDKYDRPMELRMAIERLRSPRLLQRLDNAIRSYESYQTGNGSRTSAAGDMRTLLDGLKGDLYNFAKQHPGENMTWKKMASRLALGGSPGSQYDELVQLEQSRSSFVSRLSTILKDREAGSLTDLDQLWLELQNHLLAVLGLIQVQSE